MMKQGYRCRRVIIDPGKDFQYAAEARTWQGRN